MSNKYPKKAIIKKSKKAQIGEIIEDVPSFMVIAFILILLILFSLLFFKSGDKVRGEKIQSSVLYDRLNFMLNALMKEKENEMQFSDRLRLQVQGTKDRLQQEINLICSSESKKCSSEIFYQDASENCKIEEKNKENQFCFFIPGENLIGIKINY